MWYGVTHANDRTRIQNGVYNTVLPRVGFSYQLDPNTVIRGGFGIYAYNWSNDTYNGASQGPIMGGAFGSKGSATDTTNGSYTGCDSFSIWFKSPLHRRYHRSNCLQWPDFEH